MRSAIIILLFSAMSLTVSAQSLQQKKVDSVFTLVKKYFNEKNADAIYNLSGNAFQEEISITAFSDIAVKQLFPLGEMKETSLVSFVNNSLATYKVNFASTKLQIFISVDQKNKLETFIFKPYTEPVSNKTALVATTNPMFSETDRKVDTVARTYIQKANTVGLCIGIIKDGQTKIYQYGESKKGTGKLPNPDSFFEIGSITKTFTATLLAWYVNEGKVKLSDPITLYLPDSVAVNQSLKGITLLNLINHTSGLVSVPDNLKDYMTDQFNPYKDYTKQLMYSYLKTCRLNSKPGEKYAYSNLGVGLLGSILQYVSGKTFEQMVGEIITRPLGMLSTSQYLNPLLSPRFVSVYNSNGQPTLAWDFDVLAPCGALRSTLNDLLKYASANMHPGKDSLSKAIELTHQITFNRDVKIGLGWHTMVVNGINYYFHNGGTYGSNSFLAFNAEKNIAIVVLSNAYEPTDPVAAGILGKLVK
ncbi:serine hydrolase domain-containing protein [Mucilaginibacter xinganensis]|uniref:CubicO group peptidase, beta-lactamase class C family n=1 Tax=Mucilaginibacter xinganensis TaxID=1234841 RepID=A0A223P110_9SPHI|nr:serine hydrolase domain-containing protein [Mucilaginibacter xinganensis]ASU35777.1 CubicO group peptidase, beta-lactamase class C family [Mucilaginibacter xinganensis]